MKHEIAFLHPKFNFILSRDYGIPTLTHWGPYARLAYSQICNPLEIKIIIIIIKWDSKSCALSPWLCYSYWSAFIQYSQSWPASLLYARCLSNIGHCSHLLLSHNFWRNLLLIPTTKKLLTCFWLIVHVQNHWKIGCISICSNFV